MTTKHVNYLRWLTLYLLLILLIMLLAFNLFGFSSSTLASKPTPTPKPNPTHTSKPTPTPTTAISSPQTLTKLDANPDTLTLQVDPPGLLNNMQKAINEVKSQVKTDPKLQGRRAALVIAYGAVTDPTDSNQISTATGVAGKVIGILKTLDPKVGVFNGTVYHEPSYFIGNDPNSVKLEIYFYAQ